jgi:HK97 family phage portal protein
MGGDGMTLPIAIAGSDRRLHAFKSSLEDLIALQRSDATTADLARMYAVCVTAYRAANLRALVVSQVPYRVVDRNNAEIKNHPLNALFHDNLGFQDLMLRSELTACFWGHNLILKERMISGRVHGLTWLNPKSYRLDVDYRDGLRGFRLVGVDTRAFPNAYIKRADGVFMFGVDFDNDFGGVSPAEAAFDEAGVETEAAQTALWFLRNRAVPAAILQPKDPDVSPPSEKERRGMLALLKTVLKGAQNAGRTLISSGRWEWIQIQQQFDEIGMGELKDDAREAIAMAFDVPLDLLLPTSSTYAELFQSDKSWARYFVKARCKWYATQFNMQLVPEFGGDARLVPAFDEVFEDDARANTELANQQVEGGWLTLYEARIKAGVEPDERLKDIYVINGQPMSADVIVQVANQPPVSTSTWPSLPTASPSPLSLTTTTTPALLPPRPVQSQAVLAAATETDRLSDGLFKELKDCVRVISRHGPAHAFKAILLPPDVVALVRVLTALDDDTDELLAAAKTYWQQTATWRALKAFADVEQNYRAAIYDLIRRAFARQIGRTEFGDLGRVEISTGFEAAFKQGLADVGVTTKELTEAERGTLKDAEKAERRYWTRLANNVFKELLPQVEEIQRQQALLKQATDPAVQEQLRAALLKLKKALITSRDSFIARLDLWSNSLRRVYSQGQLSGQGNQMVIWEMDAAAEHCRTCRIANGQIHRASEWAELRLYPGSDVLECVHSADGVPVCKCGYRAINADARGDLTRIPLFGGPQRAVYPGAVKSSLGVPDGTVVLYLENIETVLTLQEELIAEHPALVAARWTPAAQLHITLVFCPLVDDVPFEDIFKTVRGLPALTLHASTLDAFEKDGYRALVLLLDDNAALRAIQQAIYDEFKARDIPLSEYSAPDQWKAHITLGYEESTTPFEPRAVDVPCTGVRVAFTRGDYENVHVVDAVPLAPEVEA